MIRWEFLKKGDEFFYGAPPAPTDFWVLVEDNKKLAAFFNNPFNGEWTVLINGEHLPGKAVYYGNHFTIVEMKKNVEVLCNVKSGNG